MDVQELASRVQGHASVLQSIARDLADDGFDSSRLDGIVNDLTNLVDQARQADDSQPDSTTSVRANEGDDEGDDEDGEDDGEDEFGGEADEEEAQGGEA